MTKTLLIGDIHGKWQSYQKVIKDTKAENSIQIGDFGIGFPNENYYSRQSRDEVFSQGNHRFIRGNHDNPAECKKFKNYIHDGYYDSALEAMFIGGAASIDSPALMPGYRVEGKSWWADEELSLQELSIMFNVYCAVKPKILITHEAPESVVEQVFPFYHKELRSNTRDVFDAMRKVHKPELHVFGHWHKSVDEVIDGTRFVCLNELEWMWI